MDTVEVEQDGQIRIVFAFEQIGGGTVIHREAGEYRTLDSAMPGEKQ